MVVDTPLVCIILYLIFSIYRKQFVSFTQMFTVHYYYYCYYYYYW